MSIVRLPGLVDVHVHLREPGAMHKEDFESGTKSAIAGGYTTIIDMPNNPTSPTITPQALQDKIARAKGRIYCDLGFHYGATPNNFNTYGNVVDLVWGLKIYMNHTTGNLLLNDFGALEQIFKAWPSSKRILVHAESDMLGKAIELAKAHKKKLHACHVSLKEEVSMIQNAKSDGLDITAETTCHHLFLTENDVKKLGSYGIMKPPLATLKDQEALWDGLNKGAIDMIASDHAPHTIEEKKGDPAPFGVPGLETSLVLMTTALHEKKISLKRLIEVMSDNPRKIFGISQDSETYIQVDLEHAHSISSSNMYTKCSWTPFEGLKVFGKLQKTVLRGVTVYDGKTIQNDSIGEVILA